VLTIFVTSVGALHSWYLKDLYVKAWVLSEAFTVASGVKSRVSDYFVANGSLPNSNLEADLPGEGSFSGTNVSRVSVGQGGIVQIYFANTEQPNAQSMVFSPLVSSVTGHLYWQCSSATIDRAVLRQLRPICNHSSETLESFNSN